MIKSIICFLAILIFNSYEPRLAIGIEISEEKVSNFISINKIDIGSSVQTTNKYINAIDLPKLINFVGYNIIQNNNGRNDLLTFVIDIQKSDIKPEIGIFHLPSQVLARRAAVKIFLLIEEGRAPNPRNIDISYNSIGDFSLRPKKITNDPHGIDMVDSDKTFIVFSRNNTMVYIDSKYSFKPIINVLEIARGIDNIFLGIK